LRCSYAGGQRRCSQGAGALGAAVKVRVPHARCVRACVALKFLPASPPSPLRLPRDKLDHTRKERQEEYIRGRTLQFNSFKKAAAVTMDMQTQAAAAIERLRDQHDATRALERRLERVS